MEAGVTARLPRLRAPSPRVVAVALGVLLLLGGAWIWLRGSSLVSVQKVTITGASGPDAPQIRSALRNAARTMTTLDVQLGRLRTAVAPFPVVKNLSVSTQFPHGMRIRVIEQVPVAAVSVDGHLVAVAGDGTLLHDVVAGSSLPVIPVKVLPGGTHLTDPQSLGAVAVLAAAPYQWVARISMVTTVAAHGLVAQLRSGPSIYFGNTSELSQKWIAVADVLADPGSTGATYIDVTDPARPAAGAGNSAQSGAGQATQSASALAGQAGSASGSLGTSTTPVGG
jgi:cell division protein FtsQ